MSDFYSPETRGFYVTAVHGENIPTDAIEIDAAQKAEIRDALSQGDTVTHDGSAFAYVAPVFPIETLRAQAIAAMSQRIEAFTAQFTAGVPAAELASWPTKAIESDKVLSGGTSAMIDAEAQTLGVTAQEVAETIAAKSVLYTAIIGKVTGLRRKTEAAVNAATDAAGVDDALQAALTDAEAMAAAMGLTF